MDNRLLAGLWNGGKPDMTLFLKPMAESLRRLYSEGNFGPIIMAHMHACSYLVLHHLS